MTVLHTSAERLIDAPADTVYRYIADFQQHHPRWLPSAFSDFSVEEGGYGAGTINTFRMTLGGRSQPFRTRVAEPVPGRVLTETDEEKQIRTSFTVTPEGPICRVRIDTEWEPSGGIQGRIERLMAPRMLRGLYRAELEKLKDYARSQGG